MTYIEFLCKALVHSLDRVSFHRGIRLAGHAANVDYWINEIKHCLDNVEGYGERFDRLKKAKLAYADRLGESVDPEEIRPTTSDRKRRRLANRVRGSARRYLKLCAQFGYIDYARQIELEEQLKVRITDRKRPRREEG